MKNRYLLILSFIILVNYLLFTIFFKTNYYAEDILEIDDNSTFDELIIKKKKKGVLENHWVFHLLSKLKKYDTNIKGGNFDLQGEYRLNELINIIRIGNRKTINLRIPENIRLIKDMLMYLEDSLDFERGVFKSYFENTDFLIENNFTMETLSAFFIPNTYEIYDDISLEYFLFRMIQEYDKFWNSIRLSKCESIGFTPIQVSILASIVEEEQDRKLDERSRIAGLYINRLNTPNLYPFLQADPTVKFANGDFSIKQVLNIHTSLDHPYNTYRKKGLPPGPICIPSINAIDAVLSAEQHDYYFMCAGSNGDGYHKFTSSNAEHNKNKSKYKKFQGLK